jgi:hypothetical protein
MNVHVDPAAGRVCDAPLLCVLGVGVQATWPRGRVEPAPSPDHLRDEDDKPMLGQLLMEFLRLFGEDMELAEEGFSVRGGGFRFQSKGNPRHPLASDPAIIVDPINIMNNVARSSYRIQQVQRAFAEALTNLRSVIVRFNDGGGARALLVSPRSGQAFSGGPVKEGLLCYVCNIDAADEEPEELACRDRDCRAGNAAARSARV